MYGIPDRLKAVSPAEEKVLLALWSAGASASRREIEKQLRGVSWKEATLLNFLERLEAKGWVKVSREGNRNLYTPCVTRRAYGVYCMRERLEVLFNGDPAAAVRALASESGCTAAQLSAAAAVLQQLADAQEDYDLYDPYG